MTPSARAAAVRGDNYQYAAAWGHACAALNDAGIATISVEDAGAGYFDDVAMRRTDDRPDQFFQVKSSNSGDIVVDDEWLTTPARAQGQSPMQHFHQTWKKLATAGRPFELTLLTNRGFDGTHPLLGPFRDNYSARIRVDELRAAGPRTKAGRARAAWAAHLGISEGELLDFLAVVRWEQAGPEETLRENAKPQMRLAGLRDDDEAVEIGIAIIREMVMTGAGPQTPDDLRRAVDAKNLLVTSAQLILAVHAIDRPTARDVAQVTVDWVDRFPDDDPWRRFQATDPADWTGRFPDDLARARTSLEAYRARRVLVTGAMRLAAHFAVGYEFADVRRWVLAVDQRGAMWTTDTLPAPGVTVRLLSEETIEQGEDLAVGIALANDLTEDVCAYVKDEGLPVKAVLTLGPEDKPGVATVASNAWLTAWARSARDVVRQASRDAGRIHLFMSAPASAALMLGHQWNTVRPPTTVYEFDRQAYFPTFQLS